MEKHKTNLITQTSRFFQQQSKTYTYTFPFLSLTSFDFPTKTTSITGKTLKKFLSISTFGQDVIYKLNLLHQQIWCDNKILFLFFRHKNFFLVSGFFIKFCSFNYSHLLSPIKRLAQFQTFLLHPHDICFTISCIILIQQPNLGI